MKGKLYFSRMNLVTGGTGLVGAHLLLQLAREGEHTRAIYRTESRIEKVKALFEVAGEAAKFERILWFPCDINDLPTLEKAFEGVEHVYHCAALISFDPNDYTTLKRVNIEGTSNVVNLCLAHQITKLAYVSSIATLDDSQTGKEITETSYWNPDADHSVYALTKYGAEMEVWRASQEGLKVVIINPGVIIGSGFETSGSGLLLNNVANGFRFRLSGVTGYVDVKDVVVALYKLMQSEVANERFVLVSENWAFEEVCDVVATHMGNAKPSIQLKPWMLGIAWRLDWVKHLLFGGKRTLTKQTARSALRVDIYSSQKIKEQLSFDFITVEDALKAYCDRLKP